LSEDAGRPVAFLITPGNVADISAAPMLLAKVPAPRRLIADKAYDARSLREWLAARGAKAVIPPNPTRKHPARYDARLYRQRNRIERMFCRLKDFRRIATRYDKRADNYLSAVLIVAALVWWLN
jgi:transposase